MLVLSRKERQTIRLGREAVELKILEIHGGTVKIGIQAPPEVRILRGELCLASEDAMETLEPVRWPR